MHFALPTAQVDFWPSVSTYSCPFPQTGRAIKTKEAEDSDRGIFIAHREVWQSFHHGHGQTGSVTDPEDVLAVFEDDLQSNEPGEQLVLTISSALERSISHF